MKSTGNDIVALKAVCRKRTRQFRFYSKILSDSEQALYYRQRFNAMPFEDFVWLLWSVKESGYKYMKRVRTDLLFSPRKIIIQEIIPPRQPSNRIFEGFQWENKKNESSEAFHKGVLICESDILYFRSIVHQEFISTVVSGEENFDDLWWGFKSIEVANKENQSKEVRSFILKKLNFLLSGGKDELRIGKSPLGVPVIIAGRREMNIPVSLAHHDRLVAYSIQLKHP